MSGLWGPFTSVKTTPSEWLYGGGSIPTRRPTTRKRARAVAKGGGRGRPAVWVVGTDAAAPVAVDDEQIEPAVVVVVEPAESAAHHRGYVARHAVTESSLRERNPRLRRDVLQAVARER